MLCRLFKKILLGSFFTIAVLAMSVWAPQPVYAIECSIDTSLVAGSPELAQIGCPILSLLNIGILASGAVFVIMVFLTAYKYAMSQGDPKGISGAHLTLTYAVIGFIVVMGLFTFSTILSRMLGAGDRFSAENISEGFMDALNQLMNLPADLVQP